MNKLEQFKEEVANDPEVQSLRESMAAINESDSVDGNRIVDLENDFETAIASTSPLEVKSLGAVAKQYYSERILNSWGLGYNTIREDNVLLDEYKDKGAGELRRYRRSVNMGVIVEGREVTDEDVKRFCELVNQMELDGAIEDFAICPMFKVELKSGLAAFTEKPIKLSDAVKLFPKRTVIIQYFYSTLRYQSLNKLYDDYFMEEGVLPSIIWE